MSDPKDTDYKPKTPKMPETTRAEPGLGPESDPGSLAQSEGGGDLPQPSSSSDVSAFLQQAAVLNQLHQKDAGPLPRLIFAIDATLSRQPTWDMAVGIQGAMFEAAAALGGLEIQLVFFRGYRECKASSFVRDGEALARFMAKVDCRAGHTQVGRVLTHSLKEVGQGPVKAVVYVGDAFEEAIDEVADAAGQLGLRQVPLFAFHEGRDPVAAAAFEELARLSGGAYLPFDRSAPGAVADLLGAIATYAAGGRSALQALEKAPAAAGRGTAARKLLGTLKES